jgi:hypothetical protein
MHEHYGCQAEWFDAPLNLPARLGVSDAHDIMRRVQSAQFGDRSPLPDSTTGESGEINLRVGNEADLSGKLETFNDTEHVAGVPASSNYNNPQ